MDSKTYSRETGITPTLTKVKDFAFEPNWTRADYEIGEELLGKLDTAFKACVEKFVNEKRGTKTHGDFLNILRIEGRRYVFAQLLEMHGTWHEFGDSLPNQVQLGTGKDKFLTLELTELTE